MAYSTKAVGGPLHGSGSGEPWDLQHVVGPLEQVVRSSRPTPSMSPITIRGSGAAMSRTKSQEPCVQTPSMMRVADLRMPSSLSRIRLGGETLAHQPPAPDVFGGVDVDHHGQGVVSGRIPPALENVSGSFEISRMSA